MVIGRARALVPCLALALCAGERAGAATARAPGPLTARQLGVIINDSDPLSAEIGAYYIKRRSIPAENVVRLHISPTPQLGEAEFRRLNLEVDAALPARVQALALTWAVPFKVDCMSITSAFAFGFDQARCAEGCKPTPPSPYFDSSSRAPFTEFRIRPAMSLAALSLAEARALIDRGIASDHSFPAGTAYLLRTSDAARSSRAPGFVAAPALAGPTLRVQILNANAIDHREDVLFYFTGIVDVPQLATNHFLPGAIGDHLTSFGGQLIGGSQMSSLRWLQAGATGSYGTVVEPCSYPSKFPVPAVVMKHYLAGETLIEAYWKSVLMPSQGIFIGEPLAAPFAARRTGSTVH